MKQSTKTTFEFPDTSRRVPGSVRQATIQAMRDAKGDRKEAARALGIDVVALSKRLHVLRAYAAKVRV